MLPLQVFTALHLEPLADCEVGADDEYAVGELFVPRTTAAVAERPGDQHRHHHRLPAAGGHLAPEADQRRSASCGSFNPRGSDPAVRLGQEGRGARRAAAVEVRDAQGGRPPRGPAGAEHLRQVDQRLDRVALAEEHPAMSVFAAPESQRLTGHAATAEMENAFGTREGMGRYGESDEDSRLGALGVSTSTSTPGSQARRVEESQSPRGAS
jgi:hypothetical protein